MLLRAFLILLLLTGCGRPLTDSEQAFARTLHGDSIDFAKVRLVDGAPTRAVTFRRPVRPRTTCREKILPPPTSDVVTAKPAAMVLWNRVYFDTDWYLDDYLPDYPDRVGLIAAMLLAHELTHVWQWQNRTVTGYSPLRVMSEHEASDDPYLFDLERSPRFSEFGYEQQGAIVEEFVCCRALDPQGARTHRLHALIAQAMPVADLPQSRASAVGLPWKGVDLKNICS